MGTTVWSGISGLREVRLEEWICTGVRKLCGIAHRALQDVSLQSQVGETALHYGLPGSGS